MKKILIWMIGLLLFCSSTLAQSEDDLNLEIYQIKISKGHATLVVVKGKQGTPYAGIVYSSTLIDAGVSQNDGQLIVDVIAKHADKRLDRVLLTHLDEDHIVGLGGATSKGVLAERCLSTGRINPSLNNNRKLQLIYKKGVIGDTPNTFNNLLNVVSYKANYEEFDWDKNLDFYLGPTGSGAWDAIQLKTLAIDGYTRKIEQSRLDIGADKGPRKNNISGVFLIVWGDFSFLIQGDMEAAEKFAGTNFDFQLSRTKEYYKDKRTVPEWNSRTLGDFNSQLAVTRVATKTDDPSGSKDFFLRKKVRKNDASEQPFAQFTNESSELYKYFIANPNEWQHNLGRVINDYNGNGNYAHACVALVPHHGAMTSNLWFDTNHAIFGTPKTGSFGHPNMQSVLATYNSCNARNLYFMHLLDNNNYAGRRRHSELRALINRGDIQNTDIHVLSHGSGVTSPVVTLPQGVPAPTSTIHDPAIDNKDFFVFRVQSNGQFEVKSGIKDQDALTTVRATAGCGHTH